MKGKPKRGQVASAAANIHANKRSKRFKTHHLVIVVSEERIVRGVRGAKFCCTKFYSVVGKYGTREAQKLASRDKPRWTPTM